MFCVFVWIEVEVAATVKISFFTLDINSQVTITTKTFLRYLELNTLINSIRQYYKTMKIIIADDSFDPIKVNGSDIEQYFMPPGQVKVNFNNS